MPLKQPLRRKGSRQQTSVVLGLPAPYRGLNLRDRLEEAEPGYASILKNYIPGAGKIELRKGRADHATGLPDAPVEALMEYAAGSSRKLFAACNGEIYDVTAAGAVGAAELSGLTNDRWSQTMFSTTSGSYLVLVNGADGVRTYSGLSWGTQSITGATAADFVHVIAHKSRLWFVEKDSLSAWYLASLAIAGAATEFPMAALCKHGGSLVAAETWSAEDTGTGADDFMVFLTDQGEVLVYSGTDPATADTWSLRGIYKVDRPIGRRCMLKFAADLLILTESGVVSMAALLGRDARWSQLSDLVRPEMLLRSRSYANTFGWQLLHYRRPGWLLVNVPDAGGTFSQFLWNSQLTAPDGWFEFDGLEAYCWGESEGDLYYGGQGTVYQADVGTSDGDQAITSDVQWAWSRFAIPAAKSFKMVRPHMQCTGVPNPSIGMMVDYALSGSIFSPTLTQAEVGGEWDLSDWDATEWGGTLSSYSEWIAVTGIGHVGALRMLFATAQAEFSVVGCEIMVESGGVL